MNDEIQTDSFLAALLANGCTERQLRAMANVVDVTEKELMALHLQIHGLRSLAHTRNDEGFSRLANAVLHSSDSLLIGLKQQREALSRVAKEEAKTEKA